MASPASAVDFVLKRNDAAKKTLELERLQMVIRDNIVTPEVKANGYGGIDGERFARAIDQLALTYKFKEQAEAGRYFRRVVSAAGSRAQGELAVSRPAPAPWPRRPAPCPRSRFAD